MLGRTQGLFACSARSVPPSIAGSVTFIKEKVKKKKRKTLKKEFSRIIFAHSVERAERQRGGLCAAPSDLVICAVEGGSEWVCEGKTDALTFKEKKESAWLNHTPKNKKFLFFFLKTLTKKQQHFILNERQSLPCLQTVITKKLQGHILQPQASMRDSSQP